MVDDEDFEKLNKYTWYLSSKGYAMRSVKSDDGKYSFMPMQVTILGKADKGFCVDHINRNPLDNRKSNLRYVTYSQNNMNKLAHKDNINGLKGVSGNGKRYEARITVDGKTTRLGRYKTPQEAHEAYKEACHKYHGEFANY